MAVEKTSQDPPKVASIDEDEAWMDADEEEVERAIGEIHKGRLQSSARSSKDGRRSSVIQNVRRGSVIMMEAIGKKKDWVKEGISKLMGEDYSKREAAFVLFVGALIAFNNGYVNGACLSGLVSPNNTKKSIAGFTSKYTRSAVYLADNEFEEVGAQVSLIASYFLGSFLSGLLTPNATPYRLEPTYGPTFLIGGLFLTAASILSAKGKGDPYIFCLAAAAAGIQNGIASIFSSNLIRCSLTGSTTDMAITLGQVIRGNRTKVWKAMVLLLLVIAFWLGGLISFYATRHFRNYSLYFSAGLFFFIGVSLVMFLVKEHSVSVKDAILGTWEITQSMRHKMEWPLKPDHHHKNSDVSKV
ncbi:unnamed protein product [Cylindrotheca closterium]|uniref:DUF1275 domain-containing protein n=1 Tax=Cylindrotheca closterium TaxID=2856 RepID=A0AAD2G2B5_9STRA|nr:unnamed protein product [Cylindrotheca closterium]